MAHLGRTFDVSADLPPLVNACAALALARAGLAVFPCDASKRPIVPWRGVSTTSIHQLRQWWDHRPGSLVGIDLDKAGLIAIDADRHGGPDGVAALMEIIGHDLRALACPITETAGGGLHLYFRQPDGERLGNGRGSLPPGIDVRGVGGFTIGPESMRADGTSWRPMFGAPDLIDAFRAGTIPPLPSALRDLIRTPRAGSEPEFGERPASDASHRFERATGERERAWAAKALEGVASDLASIVEGGRNNALNGAAYRMGRIVARGWISESEVRAALEDACKQNGLWKEGPGGVRATLASGLRSGAAAPHEDLPDSEEDDEAMRVGENIAQILSRRSDGTLYDKETGEVFEEPPEADADRRTGDAGAREARGGAAGTKSSVEIETICAASLAGQPVPKQEWLVPGIIPARNVSILGGDGGTGKSLLALQLAVATATGGQWLEFDVPTSEVLFLSAEDEMDELHRRLSCLAPRLDLLQRLTVAPLAGKDAILAAPGRDGLLQPTALFKALRNLIDKRRPKLVVLDTLADIFGGDEIKKVHARQFIAFLRGLAFDFDMTVLLLAHPSQAGMASGEGTSGNTAWNNSVRSRLYFERVCVKVDNKPVEDDPNLRVLTLKKSNRAAIGVEIFVRWRNGAFVREERQDADEGLEGSRAERVFLELLRQFTRENRTVSDKPGANFAPAVFSKHPAAMGVTKRAFERAMNVLFGDGRIRVQEVGSKTRIRRSIVESIVGGRPHEGETQEDGDAF